MDECGSAIALHHDLHMIRGRRRRSANRVAAALSRPVSDDARRHQHDLHEATLPKLTGHGSRHARSDWP